MSQPGPQDSFAMHDTAFTASLRRSVAALRGRAKGSPRALALRFKRHGVWHGVSWAQFERLVDDSASLWRGLGLGEGARIRIVGAWSEASLATAYAGALIGAEVAVGLEADGVASDAVLVDSSVDLDALRALGGAVPRLIVVRNEAGVQAGDLPGLHLFEGLLAAAAASSNGGPPRAGGSHGTAIVAVGPASGSHAAIGELLAAWPAQGLVLGLPEPFGDAYRDLRELSPTVLFDTAQGHAALADHLRSRRPAEASTSGRVLAASLHGRPEGWVAAWLRRRVRRQLGLGRLVSAYTDRAPGPEVGATLSAIGIRLEHFPAPVPAQPAAAVSPARPSGESGLPARLRGAAS